MTSNELERCTPESQGVSTAAIQKFVDEANTSIHELHSLMLLRHGKVVAEGWWHPYRPDRPHMLFSLSKSFTSSAIGLAVSEGRLSVQDRVISFFPDDLPQAVDPNLAKMRVRDLLTMSSGHAEDTTDRIQKHHDWVKAFLALPVENEPGTHFVYNSGATYMLSAIIQKVAGMKLIDYLQPRLFAPLEIQDPTWENSPEGINTGGWGLSIKTEDIARFGQLYLQKGVWNGQQVLPAAWVSEATSFQVPNKESQSNPDWTQGYGYQFWRCRHNAYRGDGAFGQYCIVLPDQDAVLAITSGVADMQQVLDAVWDLLLPGMQDGPLPEDPAGQARLAQTLAGLKLAPPPGAKESPLAGELSGKVWQMDENPPKIEKTSVRFTPEGCIFSITGVQGEEEVTCGYGEWREGQTSLLTRGRGLQPMAASGAWEGDNTFVITMRMFETPFYFTFKNVYEGDRVTIQVAQNVAFEGEGTPLLTGKMI